MTASLARWPFPIPLLVVIVMIALAIALIRLTRLRPRKTDPFPARARFLTRGIVLGCVALLVIWGGFYVPPLLAGEYPQWMWWGGPGVIVYTVIVIAGFRLRARRTR